MRYFLRRTNSAFDAYFFHFKTVATSADVVLFSVSHVARTWARDPFVGIVGQTMSFLWKGITDAIARRKSLRNLFAILCCLDYGTGLNNHVAGLRISRKPGVSFFSDSPWCNNPFLNCLLVSGLRPNSNRRDRKIASSYMMQCSFQSAPSAHKTEKRAHSFIHIVARRAHKNLGRKFWERWRQTFPGRESSRERRTRKCARMSGRLVSLNSTGSRLSVCYFPDTESGN